MVEVNGMDLFNSMFKVGEEVVVIDDSDWFFWGKIKEVNTSGITLSRPGKKPTFLYWEDTRFISHDGFPVRPLINADGSGAIIREDTKDTQKLIRKAFGGKLCEDCHKLVDRLRRMSIRALQESDQNDMIHICDKCYERDEQATNRKYVRYFTFGDPFLIEGVEATLLNSGNAGWEHFDRDVEEVLACHSRDGAAGLLYELESVFHAGGA